MTADTSLFPSNIPFHLSEQNGFSGNTLDRLGEQRDGMVVEELAAHKDARFFVTTGARSLLKDVIPYEPYFTLDEVRRYGGDLSEAMLLGFDAETPHLVVSVPQREDEEFEKLGLYSVDLRNLVRTGQMNDADMGATAQALALYGWHRKHRFCANCGAPTKIAQAGYSRHCEACETSHFPRTDPVAIMLAVDGDRCLLGRSAHFPEGMVSCLAGFVEVGETLEEAVRRETFEESGIRCGRVRYHSTQSWPFPSQLMIGCYAEALSTDVKTDDELDYCGWFTRDETRSILDRNNPDGWWSPPKMAIAHQLIRGFVEGL